MAALRGLPEVRHATSADFFPGAALHGDRPPSGLNVFIAANSDGTWIYDFDRIGLLPSFRGRMPDPSRADEVVATASEARELHVSIGSSLRVAVAKFTDTGPQFAAPITLHVVGLATTPLGLLRGGSYSETFFFGTPAFAHRFGDDSVGAAIYVQLDHRDQLAAFERAAPSVLHGPGYSFQAARDELSTFARVARPFTSTLWLFALVAAFSALLIVAQALIRMVRIDASEAPELAALGATRRQRSLVAATRAGLSVLAGTVGALAITVLASPLFPLGLVHRVEPFPGLRVDAAVLVVGGLAMVVVLGTVVLVAAWAATPVRMPAAAGRSEHPSRIAAALGRVSAPLGVVQGARFAFQPSRQRAGTGTVTSIIGLVAAVAAISAAFVFGANLRDLTRPVRYGQTWDAEISAPGSGTLTPTRTQRTLATDASDITFGTFDSLRIDQQTVPAYGLRARQRRHAPGRGGRAVGAVRSRGRARCAHPARAPPFGRADRDRRGRERQERGAAHRR